MEGSLVENHRSHVATEMLGLVLMLVGFIGTVVLLTVLLGWLGGLLPIGPGLIYLGYQLASAPPPGPSGTERDSLPGLVINPDDPDALIPR